MQKIIFLIADGMGDYPLTELGGKTPLEAAQTPHLDYLASLGLLGQCQTIPQDMEPGSDIANMALLGYDPRRFHTGRGPIEAAALGVSLSPDDLVFRMNLSTVSKLDEQGIMLDYSGGHLTDSQARPLIHRLQKQLNNKEVQIVPGFQYRHLLILKHKADSLEARLEIRPPHDILNQSLAPDLSTYGQSKILSSLLQQANELLGKDNPTQANTIWPWGQGRPLFLPDFHSQFNMKALVISAVDLIKGLGKASNMEVADIPGATGLLDTNYQGKAKAALDFLSQEQDNASQQGLFVFLHLEGPDECAHAGNIKDKIQAIENFDQLIVGSLLPLLEKQGVACLVCCDHFTPIVKRTHTKEPVPFLFYDPQNKHHHPGMTFSEKTASQSPLFIAQGHELLPWVKSLLQDRPDQS